MSDDGRTALIPTSDWTLKVFTLQKDIVPAGFRPISIKYAGNSTAGQVFDCTYVKNTGALQAVTTVETDTTPQALIDLVTASGKTAKPLRCIALESYIRPDGAQRYAAIFVENTGSQAKEWFWWFNATGAFISGEIDQTKTSPPFPLRLIHIGPNQQPVGQPYNFDAVAIRNVGADARWYWVDPSTTLDGVQTLIDNHAAHKPRIYQLACTKNPVTDSAPWSVILVDGTTETGWYDKKLGQYNDPSAIVSLAQSRNARVIDFVRNGLGNPPGEYAVSMLKCQ